jgi:site-specific DNA recombinase
VFHAPIGYKYERVAGHGKMLVPKEPLASIVREAFEGYASGRFDSLTEVKRFLESRPAFPRNSNDEVHIERVVENLLSPCLCGATSPSRTGVCGWCLPSISRSSASPRGRPCKNRHLGNAKAPARADISDDFPLRGFVSCGHCGPAPDGVLVKRAQRALSVLSLRYARLP